MNYMKNMVMLIALFTLHQVYSQASYKAYMSLGNSGEIQTEKLLVGEGSFNDEFVANSTITVNGRIHVSEEDNRYEDDVDQEKAWTDATKTNFKEYLIWVEKGVVSKNLALSDTTKWPDYVFNKSYDLPSLTDLESQILQTGHLPNFPSAKEIEEKGAFEVTDMTKRMLKTIEELTLYTIDQEKKIQKQDKEIIELRKLIENLTVKLDEAIK